jgi:hypothetical protein
MSDPSPLQSQEPPDTIKVNVSRLLTTDPDGVAFAPLKSHTPLNKDCTKLNASASLKLGKLIAPALLIVTGVDDPPVVFVVERVYPSPLVAANVSVIAPPLVESCALGLVELAIP